MAELTPETIFTKTIAIEAPALKVWDALTDIGLMKQWMSDEEIEIATDWKVGSPVVIKATAHWVYSESRGEVLRFEPEKALAYTHLSTLSRLPDVPASYTVIEFVLNPTENQTRLTVTLSNFPTESIYKHLAFYWNTTLEMLKEYIEKR